MQNNIKNDNNILKDETNNSKGQRCGCYKEYRHYAKICPN
ncbi:14660_t:CDS:2 [Funneliformis caledonium]|uniref:14660_t:CDS:1 n=1 Tax=Funneliformis caledonium TaxID=1117310 RepID=A0A9N9DEB3_9GLOM|nr:14660_t:CDS:2 [Funneliformis caledonium]